MTPPEVLALGRAGGAPDTPGWTVRVVPNKFPAIPGQEVVIHGPAHVTAFAELPEAVVREALRRLEPAPRAPPRGGRRLPAGGDQRGAGGRRLARPLPLPARAVRPTSRRPSPPRCRRSRRRARSARPSREEDARTIRRADGLRTFAPALEPVRLRALDRARRAHRRGRGAGAARARRCSTRPAGCGRCSARAWRGTPSCTPRRCAATTPTTGTSRSGRGSRWRRRSSSAPASG